MQVSSTKPPVTPQQKETLKVLDMSVKEWDQAADLAAAAFQKSAPGGTSPGVGYQGDVDIPEPSFNAILQHAQAGTGLLTNAIVSAAARGDAEPAAALAFPLANAGANVEAIYHLRGTDGHGPTMTTEVVDGLVAIARLVAFSTSNVAREYSAPRS